MFIHHIQLQNWKNFKDVSASLQRRTFIIGPNASGKSNLLDVFRFLSDLADRGLDKAVGARGGVSSIRCLAARESPSIGIQVEVGPSTGPRWAYEIEFNQDAQRIPRIRREKVTDLRQGKVLVDRPNAQDEDDPVRLTQTTLEQIIANRDFRDLADFFQSVSYQHVIPQVVRDPQGFSPHPVTDDPFGRDFLQRLWNTNSRTRNAWLRRISTVLTQAVPQLKNLEVEMDKQGTPHLVGRYEHWRPHNARQNESQFSDGTIRLFGLMWALFEGDGPLLLEEPELSLHTEVVKSLPQLLVQLQEEIRKMRRRSKADYAPRQLIISTHSEELLRDKSIGADDVLIINPSAEGSTIQTPGAEARRALESGLTISDVVLPESAPSSL